MNDLESESIENTKIMQTNWEDLGISNDFLFGKVMQNPELCKELLQRILPWQERNQRILMLKSWKTQ